MVHHQSNREGLNPSFDRACAGMLHLGQMGSFQAMWCSCVLLLPYHCLVGAYRI